METVDYIVTFLVYISEDYLTTEKLLEKKKEEGRLSSANY